MNFHCWICSFLGDPPFDWRDNPPELRAISSVSEWMCLDDACDFAKGFNLREIERGIGVTINGERAGLWVIVCQEDVQPKPGRVLKWGDSLVGSDLFR